MINKPAEPQWTAPKSSSSLLLSRDNAKKPLVVGSFPATDGKYR